MAKDSKVTKRTQTTRKTAETRRGTAPRPTPQGGTFVYELDDLILAEIIPLEKLKDLDQKELQAVRVAVESTLRSDKVLDLLRNKLKTILPHLPGLPGLFRPGDLVGTSYEEVFAETLISKLLPSTQVASLNPTQIRVLSALLKKEILASNTVLKLLSSSAARALN